MKPACFLRVVITVLVITVLALGASEAVAQSDHEVVYAEDYCDGIGDGTPSNPWKSDDGSGCIEAAVNACANKAINGSGPATNSDGCTVVLPKGFVKVTDTIRVAWHSTGPDREDGSDEAQYGLVIRGHGLGLRHRVQATRYSPGPR